MLYKAILNSCCTEPFSWLVVMKSSKMNPRYSLLFISTLLFDSLVSSRSFEAYKDCFCLKGSTNFYEILSISLALGLGLMFSKIRKPEIWLRLWHKYGLPAWIWFEEFVISRAAFAIAFNFLLLWLYVSWDFCFFMFFFPAISMLGYHLILQNLKVIGICIIRPSLLFSFVGFDFTFLIQQFLAGVWLFQGLFYFSFAVLGA